MVPEYLIAKADSKDAQSILELQKLAFQSEAVLYNNFEIPPLVQTLESIQEDFNTYEFYKMVADDRILGALKIRMIENNVLWIGRLIVHPEFQNRGLGKALMRYMEQKFDSAAGFELFTGSKSTRNISFYESLGFCISGTYTEPGHSDIVMVKMIKTN